MKKSIGTRVPTLKSITTRAVMLSHTRKKRESQGGSNPRRPDKEKIAVNRSFGKEKIVTDNAFGKEKIRNVPNKEILVPLGVQITERHDFGKNKPGTSEFYEWVLAIGFEW